MIPVMQSVTGTRGNCFSACLASLFELPLSDVPNFFDLAGDDDAKWWAAVRDWLRPRGFGVMFLSLSDPAHLALFEGWQIVCGDGKMVHDPHPSQCGIIAPDGVDMIYPLCPAALMVRP